MTSSPLAKLVGALRKRARFTRAASFISYGPAKGSMSRGTLSDRSRLAAQTPLGRVSPGSRGLWTGGARDAALDAGRLIAPLGGSLAVLASRAAKPGAFGADEGHEDQDQALQLVEKRRFTQVTASGKFKRKQKGKRHKAFSKSPAQRMRLRGDRLVHETLVKPMKKLGFKLR